MNRARNAASASLLLLLGCAPARLSLAPPAPLPAAKQYRPVFDRWTRRGRILSFKEFDTVLLASATLRAPEFQEAFVARYLDVFKIEDPAEQQRIREQEHRRGTETVTFFLQVSGHDFNRTDIAARALWRVTLLDAAGHETLPQAIEVLRDKPQRPVEVFRAPLDGPFVRNYSVVFPPVLLPAGTPQRPTLRIAGPMGRLELSWTLD